MNLNKTPKIYLEGKVMTTNMKNIMLLLHDAISKNLRMSLKEVLWGDYELAEKKLEKTKKIILEICSSLRKEGENAVSDNLRKLYLFSYAALNMEKVRKNPESLEDIRIIIQTIKEGWEGMERKTHKINQEQPKFKAVC